MGLSFGGIIKVWWIWIVLMIWGIRHGKCWMAQWSSGMGRGRQEKTFASGSLETGESKESLESAGGKSRGRPKKGITTTEGISEISESNSIENKFQALDEFEVNRNEILIEREKENQDENFIEKPPWGGKEEIDRDGFGSQFDKRNRLRSNRGSEFGGRSSRTPFGERNGQRRQVSFSQRNTVTEDARDARYELLLLESPNRIPAMPLEDVIGTITANVAFRMFKIEPSQDIQEPWAARFVAETIYQEATKQHSDNVLLMKAIDINKQRVDEKIAEKNLRLQVLRNTLKRHDLVLNEYNPLVRAFVLRGEGNLKAILFFLHKAQILHKVLDIQKNWEKYLQNTMGISNEQLPTATNAFPIEKKRFFDRNYANYIARHPEKGFIFKVNPINNHSTSD